LAHLGLLPAGASLEQLMLDLNSGQAIGFYDVDTKQLYLLSQSGAVGPEEQLTFSARVHPRPPGPELRSG